MAEECRTVLVRITGRVQGVWYRDWISKKAVALGLDGWVRNRLDKSVEAQFTGRSDLIDDMIKKCGQGPVLARVDDIIVSELEAVDLDDQRGFEIRATS